jgi:hypothetical protein
MRPGGKTLLGASFIVPGLLFVGIGLQVSYGDEPGLFGRLFRFGGGSSAAAPALPHADEFAVPRAGPPPSMRFSDPDASAGPDFGPPPSRDAPAGPRIIPQPRFSRAATESDPIVTRIALARSSEGNAFGMFLQVFADGTVLDSEGVHHVSPADLKPVSDALQAGDLYRLRGHCGGPPTDFVEQVHVVVYERNLGRLRANAFSYSGNPQGCDHSVRHLHAALEALQTKLSRPAAPANASPAAPATLQPLPAQGTGPTIPLTPIN